MSEVAIKFENISKQYRLGKIGTGTLSHDLKRWFTVNIRGKEDPYLKIGQENILSARHLTPDARRPSEYIWALRDINFEVKQGEVLGIIGKNGAGKSTLLKILSRVTTPTTGCISARGRIASLLEVGTGFHPEMTGRENIYMNGSIMGMTKAEITRKLDEIVEFAGVEKYIDTPVKRYSSGMTVRLGFAIAAHLEPEILVVDEVLAVGDAEFQKKALGKMNDVSKKEGRTVLFVSHNMASIKSLCNSGMILQNGELIYRGSAENAVTLYLSQSNKKSLSDLSERKDRSGSQKLRFTKYVCLNKLDEEVTSVISGNYLKIRLYYELNEKVDFDNFFISLNIFNDQEQLISYLPSDELGYKFSNKNKNSYIDFIIQKITLRQGTYYFNIYSSIFISKASGHEQVDIVEKAGFLEVLKGDYWQSGNLNRSNGIIVDFQIES